MRTIEIFRDSDGDITVLSHIYSPDRDSRLQTNSFGFGPTGNRAHCDFSYWLLGFTNEQIDCRPEVWDRLHEYETELSKDWPK